MRLILFKMKQALARFLRYILGGRVGREPSDSGWWDV